MNEDQEVEAKNRSWRIFVVDDHPSIRQLLPELLVREHDLEMCGTAASGEEALEKILADSCDLALVDVSMPGMSGIELVGLLREQKPELLCLMLSGHAEHVYVHDSLRAGARGYVMKGNPGVIVLAIRKVLGGDMYLSDEVHNYGLQ